MAGKPATISDLFAPMQSIEACMNSQGGEINSNLVSINHAILNCSRTLSDGSKLLKTTAKELKKTIDGSLKSLNDAAQKQASAGAVAGAGMATAVAGSINAGMDKLNSSLMFIGGQIDTVTKVAAQIAKNTSRSRNVTNKLLQNKVEEKIGGTKFGTGDSSKIKAPDVSGGKGVGELAKALAEAAREIDKIGLLKSKMIKKKTKNIIGGILDVFEEHKKDFNPANMKKNESSIKSLNAISKEIGHVVKNMAKSTLLAPFAIIGAKLSKKAISETLEAIRPLSGSKSIAKSAVAARNLKRISKSILEFNAYMALNVILAPPAMIGVALSGIIIREALFMIRPLGRVAATKKSVTAALNLSMIAVSMLKFTAAMALVSILAVPAMVGVGMSFLIIKGSTLLFSMIGRRNVSIRLRSAAINMELMYMSMIGFTLSLLATSMIFKYMLMGKENKIDPTNAISMGGAVLTYGMMLGSLALFNMIGNAKSSKNVLVGGAAVALMSGSFILFTYSILVSYMVTKAIVGNAMSDGKFDPTDIIAVASIAPMFALMLGAYAVYRRIGSTKNTKRVLNGGLSIVMMAVGFMAFALSFYVVHQISRSILGDWKGGKDIGALVMDIGIMALMLGSLYLYNKIGAPKTSADVKNGALSVILMSLGYVVFSGSLWIANTFVKDMWKSENGKMDWGEMFKTVAIFGMMYGSMLIFKEIGNNAKSVALGAATSLAMSVGIAAFGFGLMFLMKPIRESSAGELWLGPGLLGAFGVEFGIMGLGPVPAAIALGAAASLAISGGIAAFGLGLKSMNESMNGIDMKTANSYADIIKNFALKFAAIGIPVVAPFITMGAAAMITAGGAVLALGKALGEWNKVPVDNDKLEFLCKSVDRIKLAFQGNPEGKRDGKGILKGISSAIFAPFNLGTITTSAAALTAASNAIRELAKGLSDWKSANINEDDIKGIVTSIGAVYNAFGQMGAKTEKQEGSLLKKLIGIDLSGFAPSDVEIGIRSAKKMGDALKSISKGLMEFYNGIGSNFDDPSFMESFTTSVANVVGGLSAVFSKIGKDQTTIVTTRYRRKILWIGDAFDEITKTSVRMKSKNAVNEGIKAVKDLGKTIKDIAIGLKEFKELVPAGNTSFIIQVASGLTALLEGLTGPLIAFGTTEESFSAAAMKASSASAKYGAALSSVREISAQTTNFEHHKVDVANAMKNISQIGDLVKGLAEGAKIMADPKLSKAIGKPATITGDFIVGDDGSGVAWNIQKLVCSNLAIFLELGKKIEELGIYEAFHDEVVQDVMRGGKRTINKTVRVSEGKQSYIAMAVNAAAGIGAVITNLAEGYKNMNETFPTDKKMTEGVSRVTKSIVSIMTAFSTIGEAMLYDSSATFDLIPASVGNPEASKMFGKVSGLSYLSINSGSDNVFEKAKANINTIISTITGGSTNISSSMSAIDTFYKNAVPVMNTAINMSTIGMVFDDHEASGENGGIGIYTMGKTTPTLYKLNKLTNSGLTKAKTNAGIVSDTIGILSKAAPSLGRLTPAAGKSFVSFANQMANGMKTLSATSTNIRHATTFVEKLRLAVREDVFGNISANTQRIASAINSIDNEIFEPYAQMIGALGIMTDKHSEFVKMQKELFELLEKIIEKINSANGQTYVGNGDTNPTDTTTGNSQTVGNTKQTTRNTQRGWEQPPTLTARLTPTSVSLDYGNFMDELAALFKKMKNE